MVSICVGSVNSVVGVVGMLVDSGGGSGIWVTNWDLEMSIFCAFKSKDIFRKERIFVGFARNTRVESEK